MKMEQTQKTLQVAQKEAISRTFISDISDISRTQQTMPLGCKNPTDSRQTDGLSQGPVESCERP